jgi:AcrR family transcriptional regulator
MNVHSAVDFLVYMPKGLSMKDKQEAILSATLNLISEYGFHGTPMSKIAAEAGVGAGTIYRYFANKVDLINQLYLALKADISAAMLAGITEDDPTETIFRRVWLNIFQYCLDHPDAMLFLEAYHNSPFLTPETEVKTLVYLAPLLKVVQAAIDAGEIKDIPFEMLEVFVYDVTVAHAKRHIKGALVMNPGKLEAAVRASWDAVKKSKD